MKVSNITGNKVALAQKATNNTSFNGFWSSVGKANKNLMQQIERGGFFAEFCIMDVCGMVLPRIYQGLHRNEKELGHLNYQAGAEEALREGITGPSMFLIPIIAVYLAGRMLGKGTRINSNLLAQFSDSFKSLGKKFASSDNARTSRAFASKLFDRFFVKGEDRLSSAMASKDKPLESFRETFVKLLTKNIGEKTSRKNNKLSLQHFNDLIAKINAAHFNRENATAICAKLGDKKVATTASDLYLDARRYMEDVIPSAKLSFEEMSSKGKSVTTEMYEKVIDGITKVRENGRKLLCIGGSAALALFLTTIPKIYQLSKKNPALNGIVEEKGGKR